jgi:hypothetical protein
MAIDPKANPGSLQRLVRCLLGQSNSAVLPEKQRDTESPWRSMTQCTKKENAARFARLSATQFREAFQSLCSALLFYRAHLRLVSKSFVQRLSHRFRPVGMIVRRRNWKHLP